MSKQKISKKELDEEHKRFQSFMREYGLELRPDYYNRKLMIQISNKSKLYDIHASSKDLSIAQRLEYASRYGNKYLRDDLVDLKSASASQLVDWVICKRGKFYDDPIIGKKLMSSDKWGKILSLNSAYSKFMDHVKINHSDIIQAHGWHGGRKAKEEHIKFLEDNINWDKITPSGWYDLCRYNPTKKYLVHCKNLHKANANVQSAIIGHAPIVLKNNDIDQLKLTFPQWKRIFKKRPEVINYLPEDYEIRLAYIRLGGNES